MTQEDELKDKAAKIEQAEQHLTTLRLELKVNLLDLSGGGLLFTEVSIVT